jgi:hypothetical protein
LLPSVYHVMETWIFFSSPSSVYSTNERSLSAHCPTFDPGELTPSNCDKQSDISSSINSKYVNMWDPFDFFDSPESHRKPFRLPLPGKSWGLGVRVFGPANDGKSTRVEEEQSSESSGILKKFRGRFAMARLKAIESRFGFRYGGSVPHIHIICLLPFKARQPLLQWLR